MKRKLLIFLALVLLMVAVFVSCDNGGDNTESSDDGGPYTVSFNQNYDGAGEIESIEVEDGGKIGTLPQPQRIGWVFEGWYAEDDTNFETPITENKRVREDMTLVAKWSEEPPCAHTVGFKTVGFTEATCEVDGVLTQQCRNPRCSYIKETFLAEKLGHDLKETTTEATCTVAGKIVTKCKRENCTYRVEKEDPNAPATGNHEFTDWMVTLQPTNYAYGSQRRACKTVGCLVNETAPVEPLKIDEYDTLPIKTVSHGDKKYVNISSTATASATSLYRLTSALNVLDSAPATYWRADTLVEKESYVGDQLLIELVKEYEVKTVEFVLPNYYGWALGDNCTVKYDVEFYVNGSWQKVGTVSDSDNLDLISQKVTVPLELSEPLVTSKIRLTVTQASRYTPAMVCEVQIYGYVGNEDVVRVPSSIANIATGLISGSYNSWVDSSAANLLDGKTSTSWCHDSRSWYEKLIYGRTTNGITNWAIDYDDDADDTTLSTNVKTISKVVVNADKLIGQTIEVVACRQWTEMRMVNKTETVQVQDTDEAGNPLVDEQGNPIMKDVVQNVIDPETNQPVKIPATDEEGNIIYDTKNEWISLGSVTVTEESGTSFTFVPTVTDKETGAVSETTLSDVIMVRVEVDHYGADEDRDEPTVTSVTITENSADVTYDNLEWSYRKKVFASLTFPTYQYVAYIQIVCDKTEGRQMSLQFWKEDSNEPDGGYWEEFKALEVPQTSTNYTFTVDVGFEVKAIRLEVTKEPAMYGAYIYDVVPYTVAETATELPANNNCVHRYAVTEPIEVVAPTCTTAGYSVYKCRTCDLTWKTDAVDMNGHSWNQGTESTDAARNVVKKYECTVCGVKKNEITKYRVDGGYLIVPAVTKYYHNAPAAWSMTFDDGNYIDTYEWVYPELVKRNMTATAVVTVQYASGYVSDWTKYVKSGAFDLGSHSTFHSGDFASEVSSEETLVSEIDDAFYTIMSWVPGQRVLGFATPNGKTGAGTANFVNDLMIGGRSGGQAGTYCDPDELTTREKWGNLPSYITYATTVFEGTSDRDGVSYQGAIDHVVKNGEWTVECIHTIYTGAKDENDIYTGDKFSVNKFQFEKKLDYFIEKGVWVGSYNEALAYLKESHNASITDMSVTDTAISFNVTDGLDDIMFVQPLTFEFALPSGWTDVTVTQNGVEIPVVSSEEYAPNMALDMACTIENGVLYFDAVPDAGTVVITKN